MLGAPTCREISGPLAGTFFCCGAQPGKVNGAEVLVRGAAGLSRNKRDHLPITWCN